MFFFSLGFVKEELELCEEAKKTLNPKLLHHASSSHSGLVAEFTQNHFTNCLFSVTIAIQTTLCMN